MDDVFWPLTFCVAIGTVWLVYTLSEPDLESICVGKGGHLVKLDVTAWGRPTTRHVEFCVAKDGRLLE